MASENGLVKGFVIEGDVRGCYYHRTGRWIEYDTVAKGYVWTEKQCGAIASSYANNGGEWPISPALAHRATYDPTTGVTHILALAIPFEQAVPKEKSVGKERETLPKGAQKPNGRRFLIELHAASGVSSMVASAISL